MSKENKKKALKVGLLIAGGVVMYKMGFKDGARIGGQLGELAGFRDAVHAISEGAIDMYNPGLLDTDV